jgi:hypothetical protein
MALLFDAEAAWRDASGKAVARADFGLSGATNLRRVFDDRYGDSWGASPAAKPLNRGQRRIDFYDVLAADLASNRAAAEVHIDTIEQRTKLFYALGPKLNAMHIISHGVLLRTNL